MESNKEFYKYSENGIKIRNLKLWEDVKDYITKLDISSELTFKEEFYIYENNLTQVPKCECGGKVKFIDMNSGFREFCKKRCMLDSDKIKNKRKITSLEKWGVDNPSKSKDIKEKVKDTNRLKFGFDFPLQNPDILNSLKDSFLEKWGVDNPMKSDDVKEKVRITNLENWGVDSHFKSDIIKDRIKKTNLEKYGVDNPMKSDDVKEKAKESIKEKWNSLKNPIIREKKIKTNLEKYGVDNPMKSDDVKEKVRITNLENWGVDSHLKSDIIKDRIKKTNLEKYGVDNVFKSDIIKDKIRETFFNKTGKYHHSHCEDFRLENYHITSNQFYIGYKSNGISQFKCDLDKDHYFDIKINNFISRDKSKIPLCTKCNPINSNSSIAEDSIYHYIESLYNGEMVKSWRDSLEIDIYLPNIKTGFEYNGLYWHSDKFRYKNYHIDKRDYFLNKGIKIIYIWEDDWKFKNDIIKSQINNILGLNSRIFARKCEIRLVNSDLSRDFLNENHIQGNVNSNLKIGLFNNDELVSLMTFDHLEGRNKMDLNNWNINRFCTKKFNNVIGGASKILKYFIKNYNPHRIISYADYDWSNGDLYEKLGFKLIKKSNPDYKYIIDGKRVNKSKFRKSKLETNLSESNYMEKSGVLKIWDSGKLKYEYINI
jgi:hypothetical protein